MDIFGRIANQINVNFMKNILFLFLFFFSVKNLLGQDLPIVDDKVVFEKIIEADGVSKQELFSNVKVFLNNNVISGLNLNMTEDINSGVIMINMMVDFYMPKKHWSETMSSFEGGYQFMVRFDNKDFKTRIRVYNIEKFMMLGKFPLETIIRDRINNANKQKKEKKKIEEHQKVMEGLELINFSFNNFMNAYEKSVLNIKKQEDW